MRLSTSRGAKLFASQLLLMVAAALATAGAAAEGFKREYWAATWATANKVENPFGFDALRPAPVANDSTLRQIVRISRGGHRFRVWLTNELGTAPLVISKASLARRLEGSAIDGDAHPLLFNGEESITIPPGARVVSDAVALYARNRSDLVISIYIADDVAASMSPVTYHPRALQTNYMDAGDQVLAHDLSAPTEMFVWAYIAAVDVDVKRPVAVIVTKGDSITDGDQLAATGPEGPPEPIDQNARYPDFLFELIVKRHKKGASFPGIAPVVNLGISGNQVTNDLLGQNAVARFGRDVLSRSGATHLVLLEGINDIGLPPLLGGAATSADAIIAGLHQIAVQARKAGLRVIGCTITPASGFAFPTYGGPEVEAIRNEVNHWIRTSKVFHAVADLDAVMRDPDNPAFIKGGALPNAITPDGLHFTAVGYKMIAREVLNAVLRASSPNLSPTGT